MSYLPQAYDVQVVNSNTTASIYERSYLIDASSGAVTLTFNISTTNFEEGQTWFVKASDVTNTVTIAVTGGLIDGAASTTITTVNNAIEIQFYNNDFYTVSNHNVGGGAATFIALTDVPTSYVGESLKVVRVNVGETGLEFATISGSGLTQQQVEGLI